MIKRNCERCGEKTDNSLLHDNEKVLLCHDCCIKWVKIWKTITNHAGFEWREKFDEFMGYKKERVIFT